MKVFALKLLQVLSLERIKEHKWLALLLKGSISTVILVYIYQHLAQEEALSWELVPIESPRFWGFTGLALLLLPVNIGLEALKWQILLRKHAPELGFGNATKAVLTGMATGIFTPNRWGEYVGRLCYVSGKRRKEALFMTLMGRMLQMIATVVAGGIALILAVIAYPSELASLLPLAKLQGLLTQFPWLWLLGGALLLVGGIILGLQMPHLKRGIIKIKSWATLLEARALKAAILYALLRYGVFSVQYYLLMTAWGYEDALLLGLVLIALIFLFKSAIPSIAVAELGIRESVALYFMGGMGISVFVALGSTFCLFLVNLILPALIGLILMLRIRL